MRKKSREQQMIKKRYIVITCSALAVIAAGSLGYTFAVKSSVSKWDNKIYSGVKVAGIDLSGKTKEQAKEELSKYEKNINGKVIIAKKDDKEYKLKYSDLKLEFNIDDTINKAFNYGKDKGLFEKHKYISKGVNQNFNMEFKYDSNTIKDFENKISKDINVPVKNASLSIDNGKFNVIDSKNGLQVDSKKLDEMIKKEITDENNSGSEIEIPVKETKPKVTAADLKKIDSKMSSFSTEFNAGQVDRSKNLELAAKYINGTVVMPGEEFSYNNTVGERTEERGFRSGAVFVNNKVEEAIGGGVCQVSTTLYRAVIAAGIKSTERHNHSLKASYSDYGLDATVSWGYLDYKFKNTYDFPIYIEGYTSENQVTFNIYGRKSAMEGKTYDLVAEKVSDLPAGSKTVNDPNLKEGQEVWETKPVNGVVVKSYRITYQNGKQIAKEFIAKDTYAKVDGVKKVGTQKVQPTVDDKAKQEAEKKAAEEKAKQEAEKKAQEEKAKQEAEKKAQEEKAKQEQQNQQQQNNNQPQQQQ